MKWPNVVYDWLDQLGDTSIEALAATSGLSLLKSVESFLDRQDGVTAVTMHNRMSTGLVCAYTGLTWHGKCLGLVSKAQLTDPMENLSKRPKMDLGPNPGEAPAAKPVKRCKAKQSATIITQSATILLPKVIHLGLTSAPYERFPRENAGAQIMDDVLEALCAADLFNPTKSPARGCEVLPHNSSVANWMSGLSCAKS